MERIKTVEMLPEIMPIVIPTDTVTRVTGRAVTLHRHDMQLRNFVK
jgi:hypothetical protein